MDICLFVSVGFYRVEIFVMDRSLAQGRLTDCDVSEFDRETSTMRPWPTRDFCTMDKKIKS
jgi:hypothetical protein